MTPAEKAVETRRRNEERRKQKAQRARHIRESIISNMLMILESDTSGIDQKLAAASILKDITRQGTTT